MMFAEAVEAVESAARLQGWPLAAVIISGQLVTVFVIVMILRNWRN